MVGPRTRGSPVRIEQGWLMVPYEGVDTVVVELGVQEAGQRGPTRWVPAFLSWFEGIRVAQVRPERFASRGDVTIWLRANGIASAVGAATL